MLWSEVIKALSAQILVGSSDFKVKNFSAADLLSDILTTSKEDVVILTGHTSANAIRTAITVGAMGVVIVRGKKALPESIETAREYGMPLAATPIKMFESCIILGEMIAKNAK